jgi:hypothetical protein
VGALAGLAIPIAENKTRKVRHVDIPAFFDLANQDAPAMAAADQTRKREIGSPAGCTGNRGKCPEPYLTDAFAGILQELVISQPILQWLGETVQASDRTEQAAREQTVKRLQIQHKQIESRIETMYLDKLDGRISQEFFDRNSAKQRDEQQALLRKIRTIQTAATTFIDSGR